MSAARRCGFALVGGIALLVFAAARARGADDPGEALREAARAGDLTRIDALLAAGVAVDAPAKYGQTPLYFAAEKGHLAAARRLVERGADVNAGDSFFGATVLDQALGSKSFELVRYLLAHGAQDAAAALAAAVESDDLELARAALATGLVEPLDLLAARKAVEAGAGASLREALAAATAKPRQRPPYQAPPARLALYAGRYRLEPGKDATVAVRGDGLALTLPGQGEVALAAVAKDRFDTADGNLSLVFAGRAGLVEWLRINRGGELSFASAVTSDPTPIRAAAGAGGVAAATPIEPPRPWPQFRGPRASGVGDGQGAPAAWNVTSGDGVRFKTPIPGIGLSSPIVWGDRIFVTSAVSGKGDTTFRTGLYGDGTSVDDVSEHSFRLYSLDTKSGKVLWEREVHRGAPQVRRHLKSSLANATPVTDGERVVVLFGPVGKLAAYDFDGKQLWIRDVGILDCNDPQSGTAEWGHASSPILYGDLVLVQGDRRKDSFLAAYRLATGEEVWRVAREEPSTWATPNVLTAPAGDELIANGPTIRAYDPKSGRPLWSLGPSSEVVVATPVVGDGLAFVTAGYPPVRPVFAVRPGRRGDLSLPAGKRSSEAIAWSHERGGTYIPTPILYRGILYTCNNNGILTAYRAETGEQLSSLRLSAAGASFAASPVAADGRLYVASETGDVYVLRAGAEPELLAVQPMGEPLMATPAISGGLFVVRTLGHVFGLAGPALGLADDTASPTAAKRQGAWGFDLAGMDPAVEPGDDFFRYANGKWAATTPIPPDRTSFSAFAMLSDLSEARVRGILDGWAADKGLQPGSDEEKVAAIYRTFLDEATAEKLDVAPIAAHLETVRKASTHADVAALMGRAAGGFGSSFFAALVSDDAKDPERYALYLAQSGLGLADREFYLRDNFAPQKKRYEVYVADMLRLVGWNEPEKSAAGVVALETKIAEVHWSRAESRNRDLTYNLTTIAELEKSAPAFAWRAAFTAAGLDKVQRVVVRQNTAVPKLAAIFAATPVDTLKAWQAFHVADDAAPLLSKRFVDTHWEFRFKFLNGAQEQRPRWKRAVAAAEDAMGEAIGRAYVGEYFPPASKAQMEGLVGDLRSAMKARIGQLQWMGPETKARALEKLSRFGVKIGYPVKWRDYSTLQVKDGDLVGNAERADRFEWDYDRNRIGKPVDEDEWGMTPQTVNAYYSSTKNEIVFPAAILQPPFFDPQADPAINYGGIGAVIGHEITHGFDDQGRKSDGDGVLRDWWTAADAAKFEAEAAKLGAQYEAFAFPQLPGLHIVPRLTMGENIGDLGGILLAYDAYRLSLGGKPAPTIDGFTGHQRVFLGWAQVWRSLMRDDALRQYLTTNSHSPGAVRAFAPLRNVDAWYEAFGVEEGDANYLKPEERVRIW